MLIAADWVVPVSGRAIREGAVLVRGGRIVEVGRAESLTRKHPAVPLSEFPGCTLTPGLVNAHTHLAMTCLKGLIPPQPFHSWISHIPRAWQALSGDDVAASIALGSIRSVACGVTVVGDIAYGPESVAIAADSGLAGTFYWEVLGIELEELPRALFDAEYPSEHSRSTRIRFGISPHAPYTSGPSLIRGAHKIAAVQGVAFAIHVAESDAEVELLESGTGPLAPLAGRLAHGLEPPGVSPVSYIDSLGTLANAVVVHGVKTLPSDVPALARRAAGVVLCPRSNEYLMNGTAPAWRLEQAGIELGLGTDSLASNESLDLFDEARLLKRREPRFSAKRLFEIMTVGGARVLGMEEHFGTLASGKQADLAVFRTTGDDPYEALIANAGRHATEAVMCAGVWRVLDGGPTFGVSLVERGARLATERARLALSDPADGY